MDNKHLIITLIKDHLINTRLINGLGELGVQAQDYHLHLSETIFKLLGIADEKETLFEVYLDWCTKTAQTDIIKNAALLDQYANAIFLVLQEEKEL